MKNNNKLVAFLLATALLAPVAEAKAAGSESPNEAITTTYGAKDDAREFPKNESEGRPQDGTDKFNRATETDRKTFGEDRNVGNIEPEVTKKLEETKGEYGAKEGKYSGNNLQENLDPIKDVVVTAGATESQIGITWFGKGDLQDSCVVFDGKTYPAQGTKTYDNAGYYSYKAVIDGIEGGKTYSYYVQTGSAKSNTYTFTARKLGKDNSFNVTLFGDPQIGSGDKVWDSKGLHAESQGKVDQDTADWKKMLRKAEKTDSHIYLSLGDNINTVSYEGEYDGFFDDDFFRKNRISSVAGNHETYIGGDDSVKANTVFDNHFYLPNTSQKGEITGKSETGLPIYMPGDYRYSYGDTLFLMLNSNEEDTSIHEAFIQEAIAEATAKRGSNYSFIVTCFHHSPYSTATHIADDDIIKRRQEMLKVFNDNGVDVVINGHDHIYTRSKQMIAGENAMSFEQAYGSKLDNPSVRVEDGFTKTYNNRVYKDGSVVVDGIALDYGTNVVKDPRGTLFLTMSTATGTKYYNPIGEDAWFAARSIDDRSQLFSELLFSKNSFEVVTRDLDGNIVDNYKIIKSDDAIKNGRKQVLATNKGGLKDCIAYGKNLSSRVPYENLEDYNKAISLAETVYADELASQEAVDAQVEVLSLRLAELPLKAENNDKPSTNNNKPADTKKDNEGKKDEKKDDKKASEKKDEAKKASGNVKTGVTGLGATLATLLTAASALFVDKKRK